tara:strand:- start:10237 stop:10341 length:105 start_codon:yes stop_codon:yes gene_type:complete
VGTAAKVVVDIVLTDLTPKLTQLKTSKVTNYYDI